MTSHFSKKQYSIIINLIAIYERNRQKYCRLGYIAGFGGLIRQCASLTKSFPIQGFH